MNIFYIQRNYKNPVKKVFSDFTNGIKDIIIELFNKSTEDITEKFDSFAHAICQKIYEKFKNYIELEILPNILINKDKAKKNDRTIQYILLANKEEKIEDRFFCYDDVLTIAGIIMNTATVKSLLGKHQEACEYAARALEMDNGMSYLYVPAAWVYLAAGNKEKAISLFKNSLAKS